jgi:hypothetical protein
MVQVTVDGWVKGLKKVLLNHLLRQQARFGLGEAKRAVDTLLPGGTFTCTFDDAEAAAAFAQSASEIGALCSSPAKTPE